MDLSKSRIGIALSGGGIRAAVYHLGVMQYMAEEKLLGRISSISSVSGASMCMGLIFAVCENKWPSDDEFLQKVQPQVRELILRKNIQQSSLRRLPFTPAKWRHRADMLAKVMEKKWGIRGALQDLPSYPFWEINCTTFETGGRFRFRKDYMGDHKIGYVQNPNLPISHIIAASAAFPVLIGPYVLKTEGLRFTANKYCNNKVGVLDKYTLWDGGVYDNLGLDALHKVGGGLDSEIDFLIVSNASAPVSMKERGRPIQNLHRLLDIASGQVEALRTRDFISSVVNKRKGLYLKIGRTVNSATAREYPTTLNSPTAENFEIIFRNGYECARIAHKDFLSL